jgi:hypothetical protein
MFSFVKSELQEYGFVKAPYEKNTLTKTNEFISENVRLENSNLVKGGFLFGLRIGLPLNKGVMGFVRPSQGEAIILDYWMGENEITPIEWNHGRAWINGERESMMECFLRKGLPWLNYYSEPKNLLEQLRQWQQVGWPCPLDWPGDIKRVIPIHNLYIAALSEYIGDIAGLEFALNRWIGFLMSSAKVQQEEREKCIEYLRRL